MRGRKMDEEGNLLYLGVVTCDGEEEDSVRWKMRGCGKMV